MSKSGIDSLVALVALSVILLTLAACSDSTEVAPTASDSAEMSVVEYAKWCAALPDDIEPPTWREFLEIVRPSLEEAESLIPPMALADLHDAVLLFFRNSVVSASGFDADAPYDYTALLVHGLVYLAQIQEMEGDWDDDVRATLVASGCIGSELIGGEESSGEDPQGDMSTETAAPESAPTQTPTPTETAAPESAPTQTPTPTETPIETAPAAPANVRYAFEGSAIRITWDPVVGADYYNVYLDDFFGDACSLRGDGSPSFCEELATGLETTFYVHASPNSGENYYWVVACDSSGCSDVDSENPAAPLEAKPGQPANVRAAVEGSAIRVTWDPVEEADYYNVYHFASPSDRHPPCTLGRDGTPLGCEELAMNVGETSYVHAAPDSYNNNYWVVACNSGGCSEIDSDNPASQVGPESTGPDRTDAPTPTQTQTPSDAPTSTGTPSSARDRDGDGLIEVDNLAQLDAIRWDPDGDGISDHADYAAAFSDADTGKMCSVESCAGYELTANLDFDTNGNGKADEGDVYWDGGGGWIPIGEGNDPFDATFEGGGRTISNLYIRRSPNVGLFGILGSKSTVSGIRLVDTNVAASGYGAAGALAGIGRGVIEDNSADGLVAGCVDHIGGLVGLNEGSIANSRSAGNVASARRSSASASGVITDLINDLIDFPLFGSERRTCYASGGGLVGENSGTIASSHSTSVMSGFTDNFGGLAGANSGAITDSYATGSVSANGCPDCFADVGGLVGENEMGGEITNSYATGGVSGEGDNFGGLAGVNSGVIAASNATGSVSGTGFADIGGLVGENEMGGEITNSYATGGVSGEGDNFGGLAGVNSGVIAASNATGSVSGTGFADIGGLVGENEIKGKIIASHATGGVSGQGDNFGGLAGVNAGVIAASYATGNVSGTGFADVGGLVGDNHYTGVITAAYAHGSVSGRADRYGGLLGSNQGVVTVCYSTGGVHRGGGGLIEKNGDRGAVANCYWDTDTSGQSDSAGGDGKTTAELQSPTGYAGPYAGWNVDLDGDGSSDDPWMFGLATEYPVLNLETLDIDHGNLNARPPLEPKANAALCLAVSNGNIEGVNAQIEAGVDVNDTCQSTRLWYDGLTPLTIAMRRGNTEIEAILVEAGAVDAEG